MFGPCPPFTRKTLVVGSVEHVNPEAGSVWLERIEPQLARVPQEAHFLEELPRGPSRVLPYLEHAVAH